MKRLIFAAITAAMLPVCAQATTINFGDLAQNSIYGPSVEENGYTITGSNFIFPQFDSLAFTTYADDGSLTLNYKGPTYTLTKDGGGAFDFSSFNLGNVNGDTFGGTLQVSLNGGALTSYAIPTTGALTAFNLAPNVVTSVAFSYLPGENANNTLNSYARINNLSVAAVPELGTWAMMILGFGLVGGLMRSAYRKSEDDFMRDVSSLGAA